MTLRSRPRLLALVSLVLLAGGCSVSPASLGPTGAAGAPTSPTTWPQMTPADDLVDSSASPALVEPTPVVGWSRMVAPFGDPSTATWLDGVVEWRSRLVAFGRMQAPGRNQFNELGAVFLSGTGESWRPVPIEAGVAPEDAASISHLAAGPRGIVVFGSICCAVEEQASWYSPDGEAWDRVPVDSSVFDGFEIAAIRAGDSGFVAVGSRAGRAAIAASNDGRTWTEVGQAAAKLGTGTVRDVVSADGRWLAVGYDDAETFDGALWESDDGVQWRRLPTGPLFGGELDTTFERLYATPNGLLLIGSEGPHNEDPSCRGPAASRGPVSRLAAVVRLPDGDPSDPTIVCVGSVDTHWWSSDGRSWERLPPVRPAPGEPPLTGPGPLEFRLITRGGPGLLNLGEARSDGVFLWASPDGRAWERVSGEAIRTGDMASSLAVLGNRVVAVGDAWDMNSGQPSEPGVWIGPVP